MTFDPISEEDERIAHQIIGAAIEVHRLLGPGFLEKIYERAMVHEWQYSPDARGYVVLHETTTWKVIATLRGHVHRITALAFTPHSRYLVTGSEDNTALVWDLAEPGK